MTTAAQAGEGASAGQTGLRQAPSRIDPEEHRGEPAFHARESRARWTSAVKPDMIGR